MKVEDAASVMPLRHESLVAWQRADDLFIKLHQLTIKQFPAFERFELGGQVRKAAYSVAANIVEGFARRHRKSRLYFLNISEGSLAEVGYCLHAACRLGYISAETLGELNADLNQVGAPLAGLVRSTRIMPAVIPMIVVALTLGIVIGRYAL
jgi:four helix bundle protein